MRPMNALLPSASWIGVLIYSARKLLGFDPAVRHVPNATPEGKAFDLFLGKEGKGRRSHPGREAGIYRRGDASDGKANDWFTKATHDAFRKPKLLPCTPRIPPPIGVRLGISAVAPAGIEAHVENEHDQKTRNKTVKKKGFGRRCTGISQRKEKRQEDLAQVAPAQIEMKVHFKTCAEEKTDVLEHPGRNSRVAPEIRQSKNVAKFTHRFGKR